jgi:transposase
MSIMPKPYLKEFRDDVVAVACKGQAPWKQIVQDFGISEGCLHNGLEKADVADGKRPGTTGVDRAQVRELKKRNRLLEQVGVSPGEAVGKKFCAARRLTCRRRTCRANSLPARP